MSLDAVETIMAVEDAFGFVVPDEGAGQIRTLGNLYEQVLAHRLHEKQGYGLSSMTFYKIRRAMTSALHVPRAAVRMSARLSEILPRHRRRAWRAIQTATGLRLPELRRPGWVVATAALAALATAIAVPMFLKLMPFRGGAVVAILTAIAAAYCLHRLTTPLAFEFPKGLTTMGQFVTATLARNYRPMVEESKKSASDKEAWEILCRIVGRQMGVRPSQLTKETDFVRNLNAG